MNMHYCVFSLLSHSNKGHLLLLNKLANVSYKITSTYFALNKLEIISVQHLLVQDVSRIDYQITGLRIVSYNFIFL